MHNRNVRASALLSARAMLVGMACLGAFPLAGTLLPGAQPALAQDADGPLGVPADAPRTDDGVWTFLDQTPAEVLAMDEWIRPGRGQALVLDMPRMREVLAFAPWEETGLAGVTIWLPRPDGSAEPFRVVRVPLLSPEFAAERPDVFAYRGVSEANPGASLILDITPDGLAAFVRSAEGSYYIDRVSIANAEHYTSYTRRDYMGVRAREWRCETIADAVQVAPDQGAGFSPRAVTLRTFRTAVAATGEFTAFYAQPGDTPAQQVTRAQNAIITLLNRVSGIYELDLGVRLQLVSNTAIIYTNAATDPYSGGIGSWLAQNQAAIDGAVGNANYDVGHVLGTGGGGIAGGGVVCSTGNKARGVSTFSPPIGDPFAVDYIAHEIGHQFNAPHTYAGCGGGTPAGSLVEPGSGVTIMAYAGICGANNIANNSEPFFHHVSIATIRAFVSTGSGSACDIVSTDANTAPTVTFSPVASTIPANTAFFLTANTGVDADGDPLTYSWEQRDSASTDTNLSLGDANNAPLFRFRAPTASPTQFFPALDDVLDGTLDPGDRYPNTNRTLNFRVTVRDGRIGGSFTNTSNRTVTVTTAAGPFTVTAPNSNVLFTGGSSTTVTWNVANTTAAPVSTANVSILFSSDGGVTWSTLVASTPNDGTESITVPNVTTTTARIRVQAVGNIFYDVSNTNFRINASLPGAPGNVAATPNPVCGSGTISLSGTVFAGNEIVWFTDSCGGTQVGVGSPVVVPAPLVSTTYFARARRISDGALSPTCSSVVVTPGAPVVAPSTVGASDTLICSDNTTPITLTASGGSGGVVTWYATSCGGIALGTGASLVVAPPATTTTYFARTEGACGTSACLSVQVEVLPRVDIDFNNDGVFPDDQDISDLVFVLGGGSCVACDDIDINNDGVFPDDQDFADFLALLGGSPGC